LVALVHAEPSKRAALAERIRERFGLACAAPERGDSLVLDSGAGWRPRMPGH